MIRPPAASIGQRLARVSRLGWSPPVHPAPIVNSSNLYLNGQKTVTGDTTSSGGYQQSGSDVNDVPGAFVSGPVSARMLTCSGSTTVAMYRSTAQTLFNDICFTADATWGIASTCACV